MPSYATIIRVTDDDSRLAGSLTIRMISQSGTHPARNRRGRVDHLRRGLAGGLAMRGRPPAIPTGGTVSTVDHARIRLHCGLVSIVGWRDGPSFTRSRFELVR